MKTGAITKESLLRTFFAQSTSFQCCDRLTVNRKRRKIKPYKPVMKHSKFSSKQISILLEMLLFRILLIGDKSTRLILNTS
jgi:hypothetical protein